MAKNITKGNYIVMGKYTMKKYKERAVMEQKYVKYRTFLFDVLDVNGKSCFYVKDSFGWFDREKYLTGNYSDIEDFNGELSIVCGLPCVGFMDELFDYSEVPNNNLTKSEWRKVTQIIQMLYNEHYVLHEGAEYFLTKYGFVCRQHGNLKLEIVNCYDEGELADFYAYLHIFESAPSFKQPRKKSKSTTDIKDAPF